MIDKYINGLELFVCPLVYFFVNYIGNLRVIKFLSQAKDLVTKKSKAMVYCQRVKGGFSMFVFAGLGNPGREYEKTRHNTGFECIDYISALYRIPVVKAKFKALLGEGFIQGQKVMLIKPQTYMNNSGESLREILNYYKLNAKKLIVIYDDIDLDMGIIRIRPSGSAGTHNGMRSIIYHTKTEDFPRIRVGIGKPRPSQDLVSFVLGKLSQEENQIMSETIEKVALSCAEILVAGIEMAMSKYNGK